MGEKKYQCLHCDMKFNRFDGMKRHEQKHSLPKYECDFCGKTFTVEKKLKIHKVIHTEEKPYLCSQCPMKFKRLDAMRTHVRGVHTDERPYPCDECSKSFKSRQKLDIHRRLHTGIKSMFSCVLKSFFF